MVIITPREFKESDYKVEAQTKYLTLQTKNNNYVLVMIVGKDKFVIAEESKKELIMKDFDYAKELKLDDYLDKNAFQLQDVTDFLFKVKKIRNHEQASSFILEYSTKLNDLKSKSKNVKDNDKVKMQVKDLIREIKELDQLLAKYFEKMEKKKFLEQETKYVQKLKKTFEELRPIKNSLFTQLGSVVTEVTDVWEIGKKNESSFSARMKQPQMQMQQVQKPTVDKWTKSNVDVEKQIAYETRDELMKMENEFNQISEMIQDFNKLTKEQDVAIKEIKKNVSDTNGNVVNGIDHLKAAKKYQRFGLG